MSEWSPHAATASIGVAFVALLLLAGAWAYTDVLADAARGMTRELHGRLALCAALLAAALAGGRRRRHRIDPRRESAAQWLRCAGGGALMGAGSLLIPGSNDSLLLLGLPLLWPHAWVAVAVMASTVAVALRTTAGFQAPPFTGDRTTR
jgi:hypothetical protein